jgi:hypothetical protein
MSNRIILAAIILLSLMFLLGLEMPNVVLVSGFSNSWKVVIPMTNPEENTTYTVTYSVSITMTNPKNNTVYSDTMPLEFKTEWLANLPFHVNRINYRIDDNSTLTPTNGTTQEYGDEYPSYADTVTNMTVDISNLTNGEHKLILFTELLMIWTFGNYSFAPIIFNVNNPLPNLHVLSPQNKSYAISDLAMNFTVDKAPVWLSYSLDNEANVTTLGNTTLTDLSEGSHNLSVFAIDTAGNIGKSNTVFFTVSLPTPSPSPSPSIPEYPSFMITALVMAAIVASAILYKEKHSKIKQV